MNDLVREFMERTVAVAGGISEEAPGAIDVLLPAEAAERLGVPAELRIRLSEAPPGESPRPLVDGRMGSPLLERLVGARLREGAIDAVAYPPGLPLPPPEEAPALLNAVRTGVRRSERIERARYLTAEVRATLQSDDLRSTLAAVTVRLADGGRTEPFSVGGAYPLSSEPLDASERAGAARALRSWLWREAPLSLGPAIETLRRRARRDLESMAEYYRSLDQEMETAVGRARVVEERERRTAKWMGLEAEMSRRRDELRRRIRPRLGATVVAATVVHTDVERMHVEVRRRKRKGVVTLVSRLADGVVEGPACAACGTTTLTVYLCDEALHPLCGACGHAGKLDRARCPACSGWRAEAPVLTVQDPTAGLRLGPESGGSAVE